MEKDGDSVGENSTEITNTWNESQENLLKAISERSNCMRWLHSQCQTHFEYMNFYLTIPNVIISTLNGSFTMSLNSLFPEPESQKYATTIIGLVSIFSAVLITMNQYVKSQQMMEAHRAAALAYGKLHRMISNELAMRRDQRSNGFEFLKVVRTEQDRLENMSPNILPNVINKFNRVFAHREIEKPEIAGDLDVVTVNTSAKKRNSPLGSPVARTMKAIKSAADLLFQPSQVYPEKETDLVEALVHAEAGTVPDLNIKTREVAHEAGRKAAAPPPAPRGASP